MKAHFDNRIVIRAAILAALCLACTPCYAQKKAPTPPVDSGAKSGPAPRLSNGRPDLTGLWYAGFGDPDHYSVRDSHAKFDPKATPQERPPFQPWAREKIKKMGDLELVNPEIFCEPLGVPGAFLKASYPIQMIQIPSQLVLLTELQSTFRLIYTDGRPHQEDPDPAFTGDAIGHYDGDTLVVDIIGLDFHTWVGAGRGWFPSDVEHIIERYQRPDKHTFIYQVTIEDPKVLTKPWTSAPLNYQLAADRRLHEYVCNNNQDAQQLAPAKMPVTAFGNDERYFDEQEYEQMRAQYNK